MSKIFLTPPNPIHKERFDAFISRRGRNGLKKKQPESSEKIDKATLFQECLRKADEKLGGK